MAARTCAKRAHQFSASIFSKGAGPSRLPAAHTCSCHLQTILKVAAAANSPFMTSRSFSVSAPCRGEEAVRSAQEGDQPSSSASSKKVEKSVGLFTEEVADAEPTLEYLDSLKPRVKRFQKEQQRPKRGNANPFAKPTSKGTPEDKQWERTRTRINASFTRHQLATLARAAKLPGSFAKTVRKDEIVRRIMVHRFGMEDAREMADRERREELEKDSVHLSFRPAELYLLLARGSGKVRQEAGKAQVAILPQASAKETQQGQAGEKLGFWIRGKDDGIARMTKWVESFKQSIKSKKEEVVLSAEANDSAGEVLPAELVRLISQLSRCFMEASPIENGKVTLSLAYLDERDAQKAVLLLRQYQAESAEAIQRIGAAAYSESFDTLRQCSMLPFVPNEPSSWIKQADDLLYGSTSDISFRVAHTPDRNAFSLLSTSKLPTMILKGWSHQGEEPFMEPFQALLESVNAFASLSNPALAEAECSATLGHVLFSSGGLTLADEGLSTQDMLLRLQDPLASPRPGIWPLEQMLDWARGFRARFGSEASRFVPITLFRSQKNISLDIWLERHRYTLLGKGTADSASEQVVLVYQPAQTGYTGQGSKLEIVLIRQKSESDAVGEGKAGWKIERTRWVSKADSDMMIPERSVDLRLSAKTFSPLGDEALAVVEESLVSYLGNTPAEKPIMEELSVEEAEAQADLEEVEADASEIIGSGTEVVERPTSATTTEARETPAANSLATHSRALPPSTLNLPLVGELALERATRLTVQTYQQRSSLVDSSSQPISEAQVSSPSTSDEISTVESDSSTPTDVVADADGSDSIVDADVATGADVKDPASDPIEPIITPAENNPTDATTTTDPSLAHAEAENSQPAPSLIREISQDLITKTTSESLRITWLTTPPHLAPKWDSVVHHISALVDRHDKSIR